MPRTRVKICGITRAADAIAAMEAGADAIGLVFHPESPRYVTIERAREIAAEVGPFVNRVGLFVNASPDRISDVLAHGIVDLLQFHGDERAEFCSQFSVPYLKALRMAPNLDVATTVAEFPDARGVLLDAWCETAYGGTGKRFDWQRIPRTLSKRFILAGGLTVANVAQAVVAVKPYAVDVSTGVEESPGIKSPDLIREFIENANLGAKGD